MEGLNIVLDHACLGAGRGENLEDLGTAAESRDGVGKLLDRCWTVSRGCRRGISRHSGHESAGDGGTRRRALAGASQQGTRASLKAGAARPANFRHARI
jgi:hypothetical protein